MGALSLFYLLHTKITMNIRLMRVQINGVRINEGPLYVVIAEPSASPASGILSGDYEEDFESSRDSLEEWMAAGAAGTDEEGEVRKSVDSGSETEDVEEAIVVGFNDISALRESLEADSVIWRSIVSGNFKYRRTDRQTDRQMDRQTDRQTD